MLETKFLSWIVIFCIVLLFQYSELTQFDGLDAVFKLNWPGVAPEEFPDLSGNVEPYFITSPNNEQYQCLISEVPEQEHKHTEKFRDDSPMDLLQPLFDSKLCSTRLEPYWTYEICHGNYARQYHEDREGKKGKLQQYYLGSYDKKKHAEKWWKRLTTEFEPPIKKVDGIQMPYFEVEMTDGTMCDLNNKPRSIKLLYICYSHGKHEIASVEEISTCEYEAVILSPLLCAHPDYRARVMKEGQINCLPMNGALPKPRSLLALEVESLKFRHQKVVEEKPQTVRATVRIDKGEKDGEARVRVEIHPVETIDKNSVDEAGYSVRPSGSSDLTPVQHVLSGKLCLNAGNGWWKYEFCYGRSVMQYHVERDGSKTFVDLGKFDKAKHIEWIQAHPQKRPKPLSERKHLSHFYGDGSICDKTGKLRQTEVRLICVEHTSTSPSSISLFLLEPKTCEYILGVESPVICDILKYADEYGLITEEAGFEYEEPKSALLTLMKKDHDHHDLDERIANDDE